MATKKQRQQAWENAKKVRGRNPNLWRKDPAGNLLYKPAHGKGGRCGWQVHHKHPRSKGGSNRADNLQAVNTEAHRPLGDNYPSKPRKKK